MHVNSMASRLLISAAFIQRSSLTTTDILFGFPMTSSTLVVYQLYVIVLIRHCATTASLYGGEFCDTETFRAECGTNEVVLMHSARYGRMSLGRCVETEMGHIGCYRDVLAATDRRCSGRRRCEIRIPDAELESTRPCLRELKSYLEASYVCLPVTNRTAEFCRRHTELRASAASTSSLLSMTSSGKASVGYVASVVTSDAPVCAKLPWVIEVPVGQLVNLTLFDFTPVDDDHVAIPSAATGRQHGVSSSSASLVGKKVRKTNLLPVELVPDAERDAAGLDSASCRKYAVVQDGDRKFALCGGNERLASTYVSRSSTVRIWIMAGVAPTDMQRFVIEYSAIGCPDPPPTNDLEADTWFRRVSNESAVIGCRHNDLEWSVGCRDRKWVGSAKNCSAGSIVSGSARRHATSIEDQTHEYRPALTSNQQTPYSLFVAVLTLFTLTAAFILIVIIIGLVQRCTRRASHDDVIKSSSLSVRSNRRNPRRPDNERAADQAMCSGSLMSKTDAETGMVECSRVQTTSFDVGDDRMLTKVDDCGDNYVIASGSCDLDRCTMRSPTIVTSHADRSKFRRPLSGTDVGQRLLPPPPPPPPLISIASTSPRCFIAAFESIA